MIFSLDGQISHMRLNMMQKAMEQISLVNLIFRLFNKPLKIIRNTAQFCDDFVKPDLIYANQCGESIANDHDDFIIVAMENNQRYQCSKQ